MNTPKVKNTVQEVLEAWKRDEPIQYLSPTGDWEPHEGSGFTFDTTEYRIVSNTLERLDMLRQDTLESAIVRNIKEKGLWFLLED